MSLSNIKEGEEKRRMGSKRHNCGGVEMWEENKAVDILGQERQNTHRDTELVTWTLPATQQNTTSAALMIILSIE